jgi:hypothetical protein
MKLAHLAGGVLAVATVFIYCYALLFVRQIHNPGRGLTATAGGGPIILISSMVIAAVATYLCSVMAH